jgi:ATP-binding cassette, subfamily B, bacterial
MGFILEGLDAEAYDRTYSDRQLIRRIISYFRPKLSLMLAVAGLVVLNSLLDTAFPVLISRSIDTLVTNRAMQIAVWLVVFILLAAVFSWTCNLFRQWFTARAVGDVVLQLRKDAFASVMSRDMSFFDEFSTGKIVSRVTSDLSAGGDGVVF